MVLRSVMGHLALACLPVSAGFASRGQTTPYGGLRPRKKRWSSDDDQPFYIKKDGLHERL